MNLRGAACLSAAAAMMVGGAAMAQDAKPKPERAPGVSVERLYKLMVGDRAPELAVSTWVKGEPVTGFEEGKVYVVECWATWCGPCIAGMPHVSELQKEYKDKGVTVIGVNLWDDPAKVAPFMEDRGDKPSGDELMQYTVALEEEIEGESARDTGKVTEHWMEAAGQDGIPTAFIVDQRGYVAWIGHPMSMDEPLSEIVAGTWDIAKAAEEFVAGVRMSKTYEDMGAAFESGDLALAYKLAGELMQGPGWDNASLLNEIAWTIVDPDSEIAKRDTAMALKAAERASELTKHEDAMILDTLAWAYYRAGQKDKAIETETKAIELADGRYKQQFTEALERMKK